LGKASKKGLQETKQEARNREKLLGCSKTTVSSQKTAHFKKREPLDRADWRAPGIQGTGKTVSATRKKVCRENLQGRKAQQRGKLSDIDKRRKTTEVHLESPT